MEEEELKACTFRPQIIQNTFQYKSTMDRCMELYKLSKKTEKREDKNSDEYAFEKTPQEYTFAPKLFSNVVPAESPETKIKEATIQKSATLGYYSNRHFVEKAQLKTNTIDNDDGKKNEPLLYIDVTLKGKQERIIVIEGDTPESLALIFSAKHSIVLLITSL